MLQTVLASAHWMMIWSTVKYLKCRCLPTSASFDPFPYDAAVFKKFTPTSKALQRT